LGERHGFKHGFQLIRSLRASSKEAKDPNLVGEIVEFQPDEGEWTILLAYATRRANSIHAAKEILLNAEPKFPTGATIKYNLACLLLSDRRDRSRQELLESSV
jgi:hypothetical protein